ncbi:MAG TPA: META domain-containing protein [Agitococcus sp.]|nr:META domain-containing protein [Agitococcus sp.]HNA21607.1 META domain-containing protein [Agitococcus sp.]
MFLKVIVSTVLLTLAACSTTPMPDSRFNKPTPEPVIPAQVILTDKQIVGLEDTMWQLTALTKSLNANKIQDGAFLNLQSASKRIKGNSGCNRLMGNYRLQDNVLKFSEISSTKIFCPSGGIVQEALFIEALTDTRAWRIKDKHLYLLDEKGDTLAVFELR